MMAWSDLLATLPENSQASGSFRSQVADGGQRKEHVFNNAWCDIGLFRNYVMVENMFACVFAGGILIVA